MYTIKAVGAALAVVAALSLPGVARAQDWDHGWHHGWHHGWGENARMMRWHHWHPWAAAPWHRHHERTVIIRRTETPR